MKPFMPMMALLFLATAILPACNDRANSTDDANMKDTDYVDTRRNSQDTLLTRMADSSQTTPMDQNMPTNSRY